MALEKKYSDSVFLLEGLEKGYYENVTSSLIRTRLLKIIVFYACTIMLVMDTQREKWSYCKVAIRTGVDLGFMRPEGYKILRVLFKENTKLICFCKIQKPMTMRTHCQVPIPSEP